MMELLVINLFWRARQRRMEKREVELVRKECYRSEDMLYLSDNQIE